MPRKTTVKVALRRDTMLLQSQQLRRPESRLAPAKRAERRHARPGAGIKKSRAAMAKKPR